jgi:signal transduction histidine kinase
VTTPARSRGAALAYKDVTDFVQALEVKDDFVASVSHELRTPLTSIHGFTSLIMESGQGDRRQPRRADRGRERGGRGSTFRVRLPLDVPAEPSLLDLQHVPANG